MNLSGASENTYIEKRYFGRFDDKRGHSIVKGNTEDYCWNTTVFTVMTYKKLTTATTTNRLRFTLIGNWLYLYKCIPYFTE